MEYRDLSAPFKASSATLDDDLKETKSIGEYLERNKNNMITCSLPDYLNYLLFKKGILVADVVRGSYLDKGYVYQIFSGKKTPARDKLIAIAFGLHLSGEEAKRMLKISGNRDLYARDARDAIILFCLQRNMPIYEANELLSTNGFELLGNIGD